MAQVLIIGGHGKVAQLAEPMLVAAGHDVAATMRKPEHAADIAAADAAPVLADVEQMDQEQVDELVAPYDVVVWSAGAGGGDPQRTRAVDQDAALRVLSAVEEAGSRLVMVSYFGAAPDHGVSPDNDFFAYADAKGKVDAAIRDSRADWVILGPSTLQEGKPEGGIELDPSTGAAVSGELEGSQIPRATVARLITEVVGRPDLSGVTLRANAGDQPVDEALDALV